MAETILDALVDYLRREIHKSNMLLSILLDFSVAFYHPLLVVSCWIVFLIQGYKMPFYYGSSPSLIGSPRKILMRDCLIPWHLTYEASHFVPPVVLHLHEGATVGEVVKGFAL